LTDVFDIALGVPWPDGVTGRALRNRFVDRWEDKEPELRAWTDEQRGEYLRIAGAPEVDERAVWAGEASSFVARVESAGDVVRALAAEADEVLRARPRAVL
jgi:nitronate monooxygenase